MPQIIRLEKKQYLILRSRPSSVHSIDVIIVIIRATTAATTVAMPTRQGVTMLRGHITLPNHTTMMADRASDLVSEAATLADIMVVITDTTNPRSDEHAFLSG
jgi:hypothetical protein